MSNSAVTVPQVPLTMALPRITLTATCPTPDGIAAFAAALAARRWKIRIDHAAGCVEAVRWSWGNVLTLALPQRTIMVVDVRDTPDGCTVTADHPTIELGTPARRRSVAVLNDAVRRLEHAGAAVTVGPWEPGPR